jgi:hypothetical protein
MGWKEKIQWQSVANGIRKEHVLRPPFLDKVLHHFFFLTVIYAYNAQIIWCAELSSSHHAMRYCYHSVSIARSRL